MTRLRLHAMAAGYAVEGYERRFGGSDPAYVTLHKLGTPDRGYFTPAEARQVAALLVEAADKSDGTWDAREEQRKGQLDSIGAGVRHAFKPRQPGSQWVEGPLSETCDLCGCDPRNEIHQ